MKSIGLILIVYVFSCISSFSQVGFAYSENYSAACTDEEIFILNPTKVYLNNDSVIIEDILNLQCCASFALQVSGVINDTLYVRFNDTTTTNFCDCECDFDIKLNVGKGKPDLRVVNYNNKCYRVLPSNYESFIGVVKKWNTHISIPVFGEDAEITLEHTIDSYQTKAFCWNGKFYNKVKTEYSTENSMISDQLRSIWSSDTSDRYIREVNGKVYMLDQSNIAEDGCEEVLIYDFGAQIGDTLILGHDSIKYVVVPISATEIQGRRCMGLADVSNPEISNYTLWIEGVGDTRGVFNSVLPIILDGVASALTCCLLNERVIYQNFDYPDCGSSSTIHLGPTNEVKIFPNPAEDYLFIEGLDNCSNMSYDIYNNIGALVQKGKLEQNLKLELQEGIYFLIIKDEEQDIIIKKFTIRK